MGHLVKGEFLKKRVFIPISFTFVILVSFFVAIFISGIYGFTYCYINRIEGIEIYHYFLATLALIFLVYTITRLLICFKISLKQNFILTCGDGLPKYEKIQYRCLIKYSEILNVAIIASEKNSLNKKISLKWTSSSMPKKYLEFTLINGKKERMCINHYTKKQIKKMLNYIFINMQNHSNENKLNMDEIMKDWYSYGGYNREDLKLKRGEKLHKNSKKDKI